jgi:hypothetical protein
MKRYLCIVAAVFAMCVFTARAEAQTAPPPVHYTDLHWNLATDNAATSIYTVYAGDGLCGTPLQPMAKLASVVAVQDFRDIFVTAGQKKCYYVTHTLNAIESPPSSTAQATTPGPNGVSGLTATSH